MEALQNEVEVETVKLQAPGSSESRESRARVSQLQGDIQAVQKEMASLISQAQPRSQPSMMNVPAVAPTLQSGAEATYPSLSHCLFHGTPFGAVAIGHVLLSYIHSA